ncbi:beta-L-arabinofuranosidase domain-containing protein [Mucilaginibacter sp. UC70_90]
MNRFLVIGLLMLPLGVSAQYIGQHQSQIKIEPKIAIKAYSFDLKDVKLLDSRFKDNMDREGEWMLSLPVERLLHSFRVNAGMLTDKKSSKTKMPAPLGGWEALDMELRGHSIGHLLSGLSFQYAATGNASFKQKIDSLVAGLAEVQATLNEDGYLSAFPQNYIDRNIKGKSVWAPWYTLHKIAAGLIDAYWYSGNTQALDVVSKMAFWAYKK